MPSEKFTNGAQTTLSGAYTAGGSSLTVTSAAAFPASGNFRLIIDSEILRVTAVSGTTFTVSGAQEGTSAANHSNGAQVTEVLTAGALDARTSDECQEDVLANLPGSEKAGRLFFGDDDVALARDTGGGWNYFGPLYRLKSPPAAGSWSSFNSPTALVQMNSGLWVAGQKDAGGNLRGFTLAVPAAPYTIDMAFLFALPAMSYPHLGFCWSDGTKYITAAIQTDNDFNTAGTPTPAGIIAFMYFGCDKYSTVTSYSGSYNLAHGQVRLGVMAYQSGGIFWLRIADDNVNRSAWLSCDGQHWQQIFSVSRTDFCTPTEVGIFTDGNGNNTFDYGMNLVHWYQH